MANQTTAQPIREFDADRRNYTGFFTDLSKSFGQSAMWRELAWQDVKNRYRRSFLGPFWLTIGMLLFIAGLGPLYSQLFGQSMTGYLPYLAIGLMFWNYIVVTIIELCASLHGNANLIHSTRTLVGTMVLRTIYRNLIILAHNFAAIVIVLAFARWMPDAKILWLIPGLALLVLFQVFFGYFISIVCARYRDVESFLTSILQMAFFISPVVWKVSQLPAGKRHYANFNPFAWMLDVVRSPWLHEVPSTMSWINLCVATGVFAALAIFVFGKFQSRISYWV